MTHTKGEWDYSFPEHNEREIYVHAGSELPLAKIQRNSNEAEANAKLIASAPELLEALKNLVEKCLNTDGYNQKIDELYNAQQAIKKATE